MSTDGNFDRIGLMFFVQCHNYDFFCKNHNNEWDNIDQQLIDSAIKQWRKPLEACVSARGGHIAA